MTDPWSRPPDDGPASPPDRVLEIELDGPGGGTAEPADATTPVEPNWRKVVALSSIAGVVLGVIVAVIIATGGDDSDDTTSPDEAIDGSDITTPETLPPVAGSTVPPVATTPVIPGAPHLPLENPTYPAATLPSVLLGQFALDAETVADNIANRVQVEVTTEDGLGPDRFTIERDPSNDRYMVTYDDGPVHQLLVAPDEALLVRRRSGADADWQLAGGPEAAEAAAEQFGAMLRSPVRAETIEAGTANADTAVMLDDGAVVRRYTITIQAFRIPEWTTGQDGPPSPDGGHVFEAYVDERGRLALVQGSVVVDGIRGLMVYRFDHDADISIDLPDVEPAGASPTTSESTIELPDIDSSAVEPGRRITEGT